MRNTLLALALLLLGVTWMAAQDSTTPGQTPSTSGSSGQTTASSGSQTTVEGCLSGSDGKYTLTDKQGNSYQLTGDTSKLAEHVGHEVKITGSSSSSGSSAASGSNSSMGQTSGSSQSLDVSSVKHVSKTCQSGGMAH